MLTENELRKKFNISKDEMLTNMPEEEVKRTIMKLCKSYYVNYFNNDERQCNSILNMLEFIAAAHSEINIDNQRYYNNMRNFINYSMLLSVNELLEELMNRNVKLKAPYDTNLMEDVFNPLLATFEYNKETLRTLKECQYDKYLIRRDVDVETINDNMAALEMVLTDDAMKLIADYVEHERKHGWRNDL